MQLVLEFMAGGDLKDHLARTASDELFSWELKILCAEDILNGLDYLHSLNIIHRDLKSRNVLLDQFLHAKLMDFGVSRHVLGDSTMTQAVGTYRWSAPEVLRGSRYSVAADMYSFGVILSELASHKVPFWNILDDQGQMISEFVLLEKILAGSIQPTFSDSCPEWLVELAQQCMCYSPEERPTAIQAASVIQRMVRVEYSPTSENDVRGSVTL
jgi:serine/threonine protein kinase